MIEKTWKKSTFVYNTSMKYIIGIDEAGRGPWAWPIVVGGFLCTTIFDFHIFAPQLQDSKQMKPRDRETIFSRIEKVLENTNCRYHFAYRDADEIDKIWIREANRQCMEETIMGLLQYVDETSEFSIFIDGCDNFTFCIEWIKYINAKKWQPFVPQESTNKKMITYIIGGDEKIPVISTASVIAKVIRDRMMCEFHEEFPKYRFDLHKGYGTKKHQEEMLNYGITPVHRKSYAPVKRLIFTGASI
jgi:ribonuclease HII